MTEPQVVNPLVGAEPPEELVSPEAEQAVPAPIAEGQPEPIERRSRRAGKQAPAPEGAGPSEQPKPAVDLTQFEEYRKVQAEYDRKLEEERQKRAEAERKLEERAVKEAFDRLQYLEQQMDDDELEPEQRKAARQEYQYLSGQTYAMQLQRWETFKRAELQKAGLDIFDTRFQKQYSPGQAGLAEFQADLATAENAKLRTELEQAKKQAVTPESLADLVRQELAKLTKAQGLDRVDLGEPAAQVDDDDAWERDAQAVNNGRMRKEDYLRKWGNPLR